MAIVEDGLLIVLTLDNPIAWYSDFFNQLKCAISNVEGKQSLDMPFTNLSFLFIQQFHCSHLSVTKRGYQLSLSNAMHQGSSLVLTCIPMGLVPQKVQ